MATEIRDASGALIGYRLSHTAQQVDDGLDSIPGKQNTLTFDSTPTANSSNPVTSGGVWTLFHSIAEGNEVNY